MYNTCCFLPSSCLICVCGERINLVNRVIAASLNSENSAGFFFGCVCQITLGGKSRPCFFFLWSCHLASTPSLLNSRMMRNWLEQLRTLQTSLWKFCFVREDILCQAFYKQACLFFLVLKLLAEFDLILMEFFSLAGWGAYVIIINICSFCLDVFLAPHGIHFSVVEASLYLYHPKLGRPWSLLEFL